MKSPLQNFFDFHNEVEARLMLSTSFEDRLAVRTAVGREYFGPKLRAAGLTVLDRRHSMNLQEWPDALVIGAASYSDPDMEFLARFYKVLHSRQDVFVFDVEDIESVADLQSVMPMATLFTHTPVLAEYVGGELKTFAQGSAASDYLAFISMLNQRLS